MTYTLHAGTQIRVSNNVSSSETFCIFNFLKFAFQVPAIPASLSKNKGQFFSILFNKHGCNDICPSITFTLIILSFQAERVCKFHKF